MLSSKKVQAGVKDSSATVKKSIIGGFLKDQGLDLDQDFGGRVIVDKVGYFHLLLKKFGYSIDVRLDGFDSGHQMSLSISGWEFDKDEAFDMMEKLRTADITALVRSIKKVNNAVYEAYKQCMYDYYKKHWCGDWNEYKSGDVSHWVDYWERNFIYDDFDGIYVEKVVVEQLGVDDVFKVCCGVNFEEAAAEGILKVWREMTGRDDLYFDYKEGVIKSK